MSDTPDLMTHERIMTGEEYVSYSDYLLLQHSRDEWAAMCGRYKQERDEALMDRANGDIATMTRNHYERILRERNEAREQRDRLADLAKQFVNILDITEESDGGRLFHPTNITSCRAGDLQKIGELVEALRRASNS